MPDLHKKYLPNNHSATRHIHYTRKINILPSACIFNFVKKESNSTENSYFLIFIYLFILLKK